MDTLLRELIVCPKCKGDLTGSATLTCNACRLQYLIVDGDVPNLLVDEATRL